MNEIIVTWSVQGEPYQVPCLEFEIQGHTATIGSEQKSWTLKEGCLSVGFREFIPWNVDLLPEIVIEKPGYHTEQLRHFVHSADMMALWKDMMRASEEDRFEVGKVAGVVRDLDLSQKRVILT